MRLRDEIGAVRRERILEAPREDVWELVGEPEGLEGWLADEVELDAVEPGAEGRVREGGEERLVTVEQVEPLRRVALTWCAPGGEASLVELVLDDVPEGTRLVVVEVPLEALRVAGRSLAGVPVARHSGPQLAAV